MARNQPFDFDDDDLATTSGNLHDAEFSGSGSHDMSAMGDEPLGDAAIDQSGQQTGRAAREATQKAAQQTATQTRSATTSGQSDSPTSMRHKRGNQPR